MNDTKVGFTIGGQLKEAVLTLVLSGILLALLVWGVTYVASKFGVGKGPKSPFKLVMQFGLWTVGLGILIGLLKFGWPDTFHSWWKRNSG